MQGRTAFSWKKLVVLRSATEPQQAEKYQILKILNHETLLYL